MPPSTGDSEVLRSALGGIYNITITVGNTTWSKNGSEITLGDETVTAEEGVMYNTDPIHSDWVLAEFPVIGWDPTLNNVSVTVKVQDNTQGSTMYNAVNKFPETGEFPMMFACDPEVKWAAERQEFDFSQFPGYKVTK